jgi:hypothetical protein
MALSWLERPSILTRVDDDASLPENATPEDLRRADDWTAPDARVGLEGLPVTDSEVVSFDLLRYWLRGATDSTARVLLWALGVMLALAAVWGRSVLVGVFALGSLLAAGCWTVARVRDVRDAERIRDRFGPDGEDRRANR